MVIELSTLMKISLIKHVFYDPIRLGHAILEEILAKFKHMTLNTPLPTQNWIIELLDNEENWSNGWSPPTDPLTN